MVEWKETQTDLSLNPGPASYQLGTLLSILSPVYKMGITRPNLEGSGQENSVSPVPGTGDSRIHDCSQLCQKHLASRLPHGPQLPQ